MGENEKFHIERLEIQLVFQVKQTISSWWKNGLVDQNLTQHKQICRNYVSKTVAVQLMASSWEENPISDIHVDPLEGG